MNMKQAIKYEVSNLQEPIVIFGNSQMFNAYIGKPIYIIIGEQISENKNIKSIEMTVQNTKIKKGYIKKIDNINAEIILCDGGHIFTELTTCYNTWHDANRDLQLI